MSMGFYRYRIATDDEVKQFLNSDTESIFEFPLLWYYKYQNKSFMKLGKKYGLIVHGKKYNWLKLVEIKNKYCQYGYPMKRRWFRMKYTEVLFDNLNSFIKYCNKYMNYKKEESKVIIDRIVDDYENGEFIMISY